MSSPNPEEMEKARRARDKLAAQYLHHPEVSLIDIGLDPLRGSDPNSGSPRLVVRVHLRQPPAGESSAGLASPASSAGLAIPAEVDGVPVRVLTGDYRLE